MAAVRNIVLCYCVVVLVACLGVNISSAQEGLANLGERCEENAQCNGTTLMCGKNHTCTLIADTVGESCFANTTCFLEDGQDKYVSCTNGKCSCISGYEPTKDNKTCVKTKPDKDPNTGSLPLLSLSTVVFALVAKMLS